MSNINNLNNKFHHSYFNINAKLLIKNMKKSQTIKAEIPTKVKNDKALFHWHNTSEKKLTLIYIVFLAFQEVPELDQHLEWVQPDLDKLDLPKLQKDLPDSYRYRMNVAAQQWWTNFIDQLTVTYEVVRGSSAININPLSMFG